MTPELWILLGGIVVFVIGMLYEHFKKRLAASTKKRALTPAVVDSKEDWESSFLRIEAAKHYTTAIVPVKGSFFSSKKLMDGFNWKCACGKSGKGYLSLDICERTYNKHTKEEREKALAAIGRFK